MSGGAEEGRGGEMGGEGSDRQTVISHEGPVEEGCKICMDRTMTHGFLHGESVHFVCCESCALRSVNESPLCPFCREPVDSIKKILM